MTRILTSVAALAFLSLSSPVLAQSADVTVTLTGLEPRGGKILASLAGPDTFMRGAPEHNVEVAADGSATVTLTFRGVPAGEWALMAMHDEDGDGEFDMNGYMPAEGYAFSNQRGPMMAMPTFGAHKVVVAPGAVITAEMIYP